MDEENNGLEVAEQQRKPRQERREMKKPQRAVIAPAF